MKSPSGGTAGRRKHFWNSRTSGVGPVIEFGLIVIACILVGICGRFCGGMLALLGNALVDGLPTAISHFSICNVLRARHMAMITTIFTSPLEFLSHHSASLLRQRRDSDNPDSMTSVGQSFAFLRVEG